MANGPGVRKNENKHLFFSGVVLLGMANILVKVIGLLFKIPMSYYLGDEGMGYFNAAYQIYTWLYMLSTAGLPVAVSILISESRAQGNLLRIRRIYRTTCFIFILLGLCGAALMFFGAAPLAALIGSPDARYCIMAIAPTLFFICISSALRGYFQGFQQMGPPAMSQVIEALGKLLIGVVFAIWAQGEGYSLPLTAAFAVVGLAVGEAVGMFYLLIARRRYEKRGKLSLPDGVVPSLVLQEEKGLLRRIIAIAVPVTVSASVMSLSSLIDLVLIQHRLQDIGYSVAEATAFYGNYTTLAVPMFNLPPALIYPIATALTPLLSSVIAAGNHQAVKKLTVASVRITVLIALPCALGLSVLGLPILKLFFRADMAESAAPLLSILALAVVFISLLSVTNAVLQANGMAGKPMISMLVGALVKLVSNYVLVGIPGIGGAGVPIGTLLCYFVAASINLFFVLRVLEVPLPFSRTFLRPLAAAILTVGAAAGVYLLLGGDAGGRFSVIPAILLAVPIYVAAVFFLRCIASEDILLLPAGEKIMDFWRKKQKNRKIFRKN